MSLHSTALHCVLC